MEKIGLLAGVGKLPVEFAESAVKFGFEVAAIGLVDGVEPALKDTVKTYAQISAGSLDKIFTFLRENEIKKVTMIGKITKELLFNGQVALDERMQKIIGSLPDNSDDTLMLAFVRELALEGITVLDQTALIRPLLVQEGVLSARQPSDHEMEDIEFGFKMAKAIGGLDIGQTVVVKDRAVMAVEAIEGTDACIRRGGKLACGSAVIVKVAKPKQDMRFDIPAVGLSTLQSMLDTDAKVIAMEAGKTLLVDKAKFLAAADEKGIAVVAI